MGFQILTNKFSQPTVSPASSADMAPISSGSSTWTSSGIPFSFVSMATGIGPSSSGSQATVASLLTSTLLAGLGFSGGVISSFPSSVWPSRAPTHNPTSVRQTTESVEPTTTSATVMVAASDTGGEEKENSQGKGEDGEKEGEDEEEEEEEKGEKKRKKGTGSLDRTKMKDSRAVVNEPPAETTDTDARAKNQTGPDLRPPDHLEYAQNPLQSRSTTITTIEETNQTEAFPMDSVVTLRPKRGGRNKQWPFSIHTGKKHQLFVTLLTTIEVLAEKPET